MSTVYCSTCGREMTADDETIATALTCPACAHPTQPAAVPGPAANPSAGNCGFCLSPIDGGSEISKCPSCQTFYHSECWQENGGCGVYGCSQAATVEPRGAVEIPVSYWGQENKPCPACGREILAAAVRCRFCGATFASAQPEDAAAFAQRCEREKRLPLVKRRILWIFVLSVVPCTAPAGGLWGLLWYPLRRSDIKALPSLYSALCKIGIAVGLGQTVLLVLVAIIYGVTRGS